MTTQLVIATFLIISAAAFLGVRAWRTSERFKRKDGCGPDCGCGK